MKCFRCGKTYKNTYCEGNTDHIYAPYCEKDIIDEFEDTEIGGPFTGDYIMPIFMFIVLCVILFMCGYFFLLITNCK